MKVKHVKWLDRKHRYIMYVMKKVAQRSTGMGLNIMKFHAIIHLMDDILAFGVPLEFDTAANESHHKPAKYAAKLTQRNEDTFQWQVAQRMFEFHILDLAIHEMTTGERISDYFHGESAASSSDTSTSGSDMSTSRPSTSTSSDESQSESDATPVILTDDTQMRVFVDEETGENSFRMLSKSKWAAETQITTELLDFLVELQAKILPHASTDYLPIYTRHVRDKQIFRGHPNFRGQGPWRDWAVIDLSLIHI